MTFNAIQNESILIWESWIILRLDLCLCFIYILTPALSLKCPTVPPRPVCLCVFNWAFRPHRIWPMTARQTETLFSSRYKVSLSLFSSGNCSRDSIKVNDITCMCSISAGTGSEYITLRKREDGLGLSSPVFTHMLCYRVGLNHITVYNSYHSGPPLCFPIAPSVPGRSPRGEHMLSSLPSQRGSAAWQPSSLLSPWARGCRRRGRGERYIQAWGVKWEMGRDLAVAVAKIEFRTGHEPARKQKCCLHVGCSREILPCASWGRSRMCERSLQTHDWLFLARGRDVEILAALFIEGLQLHLSALGRRQTYTQRERVRNSFGMYVYKLKF